MSLLILTTRSPSPVRRPDAVAQNLGTVAPSSHLTRIDIARRGAASSMCPTLFAAFARHSIVLATILTPLPHHAERRRFLLFGINFPSSTSSCWSPLAVTILNRPPSPPWVADIQPVFIPWCLLSSRLLSSPIPGPVVAVSAVGGVGGVAGGVSESSRFRRLISSLVV